MMPNFFNVPNPDFPTKQDFIDYITEHHGEDCILYQTSTWCNKPMDKIHKITILSAPCPDPLMPGTYMVDLHCDDHVSHYTGDLYGYCSWKTVFKSYNAAKAHYNAAIDEFNNNANWQEYYEETKAESGAFWANAQYDSFGRS